LERAIRLPDQTKLEANHPKHQHVAKKNTGDDRGRGRSNCNDLETPIEPFVSIALLVNYLALTYFATTTASSSRCSILDSKYDFRIVFSISTTDCPSIETGPMDGRFIVPFRNTTTGNPSNLRLPPQSIVGLTFRFNSEAREVEDERILAMLTKIMSPGFTVDFESRTTVSSHKARPIFAMQKTITAAKP
jgi:hypothetical protein